MNPLIFFGVNFMYTFHAYKLMADLLAVYGIDLPIDPDRSTLHRWRASGRVPDDTFRLVYYYSRCVFHDYALDIDLRDVFETCGFTTDGLC
ncbi:MAG: excisionase [Inoviridae sp.]|nr:MAG: excisionase [Inoviridae sp.]